MRDVRVHDLVIDGRAGFVEFISAGYSGLPPATEVELQLLRRGEKAGYKVASGTVRTDGTVNFSSPVGVRKSAQYWTNEAVMLRLVEKDGKGKKRYQVFHVRPKCTVGFRYWLWWASPLHWIEYYLTHRGEYWVNICESQLV